MKSWLHLSWLALQFLGTLAFACLMGWVCAGYVASLVRLLSPPAIAAQGPIKPSPVRVVEMTLTPAMELNGTLTSVRVSAKLQTIDALPSGEIVVRGSDVVTFDLIRPAGQSVLVSGNSRAFYDLAVGLYAAVLLEHEKPPEPLPDERRKTRREP